MSGHSHWAGIKHKKGAADAKRSQVFSKLAKEIVIAAKEGTDPSANPGLRSVIDKARSFNMPSDNITRAIKKGSGEEAKRLAELLLEAYGPGGIAILISAITDNRNRTIGEIKQILGKNQGKLVEGGAVQWLFERRGVVTVEPSENQPSLAPKEDIELLAIEAGAEDTHWQEETLDIYANPAEFGHIKQVFEQKGFAANSSLDWVAKERTEITQQDKERTEKLFEALDDQEDVQDIYSNL